MNKNIVALSVSAILLGCPLMCQGCSGSNTQNTQASSASSSESTSEATACNTDEATTFVIKPALSDSYEKALLAAQEQAPDAKLVAIKSSTEVYPGTEFDWMYLFGSAITHKSYTVFVSNGSATAAEYGDYGISDEDFASIPDASQIIYDADISFQQVVNKLPSDARAQNLDIYLMTYVYGDADPKLDTMQWFFDFNPDTSEGSNNTSDSGYTEFMYVVNAKTGAVGKIR